MEKKTQAQLCAGGIVGAAVTRQNWSGVLLSSAKADVTTYHFDQMDASRGGFSWVIWDHLEECLGKDCKGIFQKGISRSSNC